MKKKIFALMMLIMFVLSMGCSKVKEYEICIYTGEVKNVNYIIFPASFVSSEKVYSEVKIGNKTILFYGSVDLETGKMYKIIYQYSDYRDTYILLKSEEV